MSDDEMKKTVQTLADEVADLRKSIRPTMGSVSDLDDRSLQERTVRATEQLVSIMPPPDAWARLAPNPAIVAKLWMAIGIIATAFASYVAARFQPPAPVIIERVFEVSSARVVDAGTDAP